MKAKSFTIYFNGDSHISEVKAIVPSFNKIYDKLSDKQKENINTVYSDNVEIDINDFDESNNN